jgi:hypothetical protein
MKLDVIAGPEKVRTLVMKNICPYCRKKTAIKLGNGVVGRLASQTRKKSELICYHCKNPDCEKINYYVRKVDVDGYMKR